MSLTQRIADLAQARGDDPDVDSEEHVLRLACCRLVERVGHRERCLRPSELDQDARTKLAETPGQLLHHGRIRRDAKRRERPAAHARERTRDRLITCEARTKDRVGKRLTVLARAVEVLHLSRRQGLLRDEKLGQLGLHARGSGAVLDPGDSGRRPHHAQDLLRRLVLGDVRDRAGRQRQVLDPRVEGEEDDLGLGEIGAEHPRDLKPGHPGHRVVEQDQVGPKLDRLLRCLVAVSRLADDLELGIRIDERTETLAYGEVVVGDQNPLWHGQ